VGFQSMVAREVKGVSNTPKVEYIPWDLCFTRINEKIKEFTPVRRKFKPTLPSLTWGNDKWKLYHAFKSNMRQNHSYLTKNKRTIRNLQGMDEHIRYPLYYPYRVLP